MDSTQQNLITNTEKLKIAVKPSSEINEQFNQECLAEHNRLRALHGCPPLELDRNLAAKAQEHTEMMALKNQMHHRLSPNHGENLSMREGDKPTVITGQQATLRWYSEVQRFKYGEEKQSMSGEYK
ncbi:Golgi-associated plant pathogenesis protein 1 [Fasciolopsis buskii]|uniref:Golgi-associated plant pathogenesis protein 1 n=1 Tax=Fasciolopsis buskii TaxID=27845 RepID=A0A8E0RJX9_9TREM|nr:Golgi-associated plant pathogenesis protein 1 [Fasciolopsis buski]